ncbi:hypothetical protein GF351_01405, partial [Candidatus Woesearchaeota archaeon]|nr:hypothetical protein [Candidatus Woesearchaeota archaeon]
MNKSLNKKDLQSFFESLMGEYTLIGPVKKQNHTVFDKIGSFEELEWGIRPDYSFRKFFFPPKETMFEFKGNKIDANDETEKRIIILRPCDANALALLDRIFLTKSKDPYYKKKRENTLIFVFRCKESGENCFCTSMNTDKTTNFDLQFTDIGERYLVEVKPGSSEIAQSKLFEPIMREGESKLKCKRNMVVPHDFVSNFNHPAWKKNADDCLFCCACLTVCPTCHCYDVDDEVNIDLKSGKRVRDWHFCYLKDFTRVAGDHVFRDEPEKRYRNRFYCKLKYLRDKYGKQGCVGCGRCIDICPAELDFIENVNDLNSPSGQEDQEKGAEEKPTEKQEPKSSPEHKKDSKAKRKAGSKPKKKAKAPGKKGKAAKKGSKRT